MVLSISKAVARDSPDPPRFDDLRHRAMLPQRQAAGRAAECQIVAHDVAARAGRGDGGLQFGEDGRARLDKMRLEGPLAAREERAEYIAAVRTHIDVDNWHLIEKGFDIGEKPGYPAGRPGTRTAGRSFGLNLFFPCHRPVFLSASCDRQAAFRTVCGNLEQYGSSGGAMTRGLSSAPTFERPNAASGDRSLCRASSGLECARRDGKLLRENSLGEVS